MAGIQIDDGVMKEVVTAAILKTLTDDAKQTLIRDAIASLLAPMQSTGYNPDKRTKLQAAFEEAMYTVARAEVTRMLQEDPKVKELLQELIRKGLEAAVQDTDVIGNFTSALAKAFASRGY